MSSAHLAEPRVALVTGAAGGIGGAVARRLVSGGDHVALLDTDGPALTELATDLAATTGAATAAIVADVADPAAVARAVARVEAELGAIDVLVCAAGVLRMGSLLDTDDDAWTHTFDVNARGVFHTLRAVGAGMRERRRGTIVVVSSNAAHVPRAGMAAYSASKAAATMIARVAGLELATFGIRCNVVEPGSTDTPMQREVWPDAAIGTATAIAGDPARFRLGIPLGRIADPVDVADAVEFLVSDRSRHLTLQRIRVDGGATP